MSPLRRWLAAPALSDKRRIRRAMMIALLTAVFGFTMSLLPFGGRLEEAVGLDWLFNLRGARDPPPAVVIVSEDEKSSDVLGLPRDPREWPRSYHARLVERLAKQGARVIAFDHFFRAARSNNGDRAFAKAIRSAGNVVLTGNLEMRVVKLKDGTGGVIRRITVERLVPPTPILARQALSFAPFPLPKVPVTVSRYWTFKQTVGVPTLPVVVLQAYALQHYGDLVAVLKKARGELAAERGGDRNTISTLSAIDTIIRLKKNDIEGADAFNVFVREMRTTLGTRSPASRIVMKTLEGPSRTPFATVSLLKALVDTYRDGDSRYLNFYGPAQTITTVPYWRALRSDHPDDVTGHVVNFKDKVVFVGESNDNIQTQRDSYHTVFSQPDGLDLSGVEIAATAFANLLDDAPLRPIGLVYYVMTILLFGIIAGTFCYLLGPVVAALCAASFALAYFAFAYFEFTANSAWFPLVVPLAFQAPFAFVVAFLWKYLDARKVEAAHEMLQEVDRLKTMFLSQVSHELKTPLASIKGFVDNLLDGLAGDLQEKQRDYLNRVRTNTTRLTRMVTDLLDLSRIEAGTQHVDRVPMRACELVEEAITQFHLIAQSKMLTLEMLCEDPKIFILADHDKFIQVITNLVDNAIKFTPAGGRVTVAVKRHEPRQVLVSVRDTGPGISADVIRNHLFKPFYQGERLSGAHGSGLGLGLSIVETLVELHDGIISVVSKAGIGSEFRILLPIPDEEEISEPIDSPRGQRHALSARRGVRGRDD